MSTCSVRHSEVVDRDGATTVREDGSSLVFTRGAFSPTPLYYVASAPDRHDSSLRRLAASLAVEADAVGVRDYLCYGFVPAPRTVIAGIRAVPPGTTLRFSADRREVSASRVGADLHGDVAAPERLFDALVVESRRGATAVWLSGGLDSAVVAATLGAPLTALHARFPVIDLAFDEDTRCARETADFLSLGYDEVEVGSWRALVDFSAVVRALDAPLADPVTLPFLELARGSAIAGHHRVATGEGGDQLFGSWPTKPMLVAECYRGGDPRGRSETYLDSFHKLSREWPRLLHPRLRAALPADADPTEAIDEAFASAPMDDYLDRLRWVDLRLKGMQHIQPRIAAMARDAGVELVHPFFAPSLIAASFAWPRRDKLDGAVEKPLLKRVANGRVPAAVIARRKSGMGVPASRWFQRCLRPLAWRLLGRRRLERGGILDAAGVRALLAQDLRASDLRPRRWGDRLWMLCVLVAWFESLERVGGSHACAA